MPPVRSSRSERTTASRDDATGHHKRTGRDHFAPIPSHIPDGPHRRKLQKIKEAVIRKAQAKREYQKMLVNSGMNSQRLERLSGEEPQDEQPSTERSDRPARPPKIIQKKDSSAPEEQRQLQPKIQPTMSREQMRSRMAKARGDKTGKRKLGQESHVLLAKVRAMMD